MRKLCNVISEFDLVSFKALQAPAPDRLAQTFFSRANPKSMGCPMRCYELRIGKVHQKPKPRSPEIIILIAISEESLLKSAKVLIADNSI